MRYVKNWHKYLLLHSLFGVVNLLTLVLVLAVVVLDRSWLFNWPGFSTMGLPTQIHFIVGMLFITVIVGVQVLGLVVKSQLEGTQVRPDVMLRKKRVHRIVGYSIYTLSKAQLVLGWFVPGPTWAPMMTVLLVYYVLFFGVKFLYLERLYGNQDERLYIPIYE